MVRELSFSIIKLTVGGKREFYYFIVITLEIDVIVVKKHVFKFRWKVWKIKVKKKRNLMLLNHHVRVQNTRALHNVLNMPEYVLPEFWIYIWFLIYQDSKYDRVLNMQEVHGALTKYATIWLNMSKSLHLR